MDVDVIVEIPMGSRNKYEMDHKTGHIRLDRMLFTSTRWYGWRSPPSPGWWFRPARSRCSGCSTSTARTPRS